jgi:hypothetical protein
MAAGGESGNRFSLTVESESSAQKCDIVALSCVHRGIRILSRDADFDPFRDAAVSHKCLLNMTGKWMLQLTQKREERKRVSAVAAHIDVV